MHGRTLLIAAAAVAAALALTTPAAAERIDLDASDGGTRVTVHPGDTIRIELDANRTTGYDWSVTARPDSAVVRLRSSRYRAPAESRPGAGGTQVYVLKARSTGRTRFAAVYRQVGSGDRGARFSVRLRVAAHH